MNPLDCWHHVLRLLRRSTPPAHELPDWYTALSVRARMHPERRLGTVWKSAQRKSLTEDLIRALARNDTNFIIGGSVAAAIYGARSEPNDLDIFCEPGTQNLQRVAAAIGTAKANPANRMSAVLGQLGNWCTPQEYASALDITLPNISCVGTPLITPAGCAIDVNVLRNFQQWRADATQEFTLWGLKVHIINLNTQIAWLTHALAQWEQLATEHQPANSLGSSPLQRWQEISSRLSDLLWLRAFYECFPHRPQLDIPTRRPSWLDTISPTDGTK